MRCELCKAAIRAGQKTNNHHPKHRSEGGTETVLVHAECHVRHHSSRGDYALWGRAGGQIMAETGLWAFNLRNVRRHPSYEVERRFPGAKRAT